MIRRTDRPASVGVAALFAALVLAATASCAQRDEGADGCLVATVGDVPLYRSDVERARSLELPRLDPARAERLLVEASIVWLSEQSDSPRPSRIDVPAAIQAHKRFLRVREVGGGKTIDWLRSARQEIAANRGKLGVTTGACAAPAASTD
jgi:hypothetical protein